MGPELLIGDRREQAGSSPSAGDDVEGRGWLADLLAVAAGELLADGLDDLPLTRNDLQGLGNILAQLAQPRSAAAITGRRRIDDDPLSWQMVGEGGSGSWGLALKACNAGCAGDGLFCGQFILGGCSLKLLELQFHLVNQACASLGLGAVELALHLGDDQLLIGDQGLLLSHLGMQRQGDAPQGVHIVRSCVKAL